ncbi:response regulator transcription factor [Faecalicatena contorta]|uniref:response regulator transcription factor n=1 Tax=Faecalicatena contorta TaxID=39482 RepID=UPI001F3BD00B|nr:response regulator [Faecalicatena contorta]MCF2683341.1 response regulator [Faecalicatena contorta]
MELLKLVIVDDEPILLEGLLKTYDWNKMGFEVVGTAQSGEQAIRVIREKQPHVVLTDIRMKQITGLMVMEEIQKEGIDCLFIVLSAYRDFEYAQQACDLGAHAYLLKPIEDDKLQETMQSAYDTCMEQLRNQEKYNSWERLLKEDSDSFLQVVVQKYIQNRIPQEKIEEVFATLQNVILEGDRFISVCVDIDLAYKITNELEYEASRYAMVQKLESMIKERFFYWKFESEDGNCVFVIKTQQNASVRELKQMLEYAKKEEKSPIIASISKPYKGIHGIKRSCEEAQKLFGLASISGASAFTIPEEMEEKSEKSYPADVETLIVNAVRKNNAQELKDAFISFIYSLPNEEELQCQYMHKVMLKAEFMLKDSYGLNEELKSQFQNYYANLKNLNAARSVDVCYKILGKAIEVRIETSGTDETKYFKEYMSDAVAYIEEHLNDESLSIVEVATQVYLNPVYFGRVFKNTFQMTFKKYLLHRRMEKAKELLEHGDYSIGMICEQVGISNPSYFSHLFKQYTGKLPSEYKREYKE